VHVERAYLAKILELLRLVRGWVGSRLPVAQRLLAEAHATLHADAPAEWGDELQAIRVAVDRSFTERNLAPMIAQTGQATADAQKRELGKQLKAAIGLEVPIRDPKLQPRLEAWTAENVALIKSIPARYLDDVQKVVTRSIADGDRWEELADKLEERFGVAESSAQLVARDQVGKFYAAVGQARQEDLGVTRYTWRTSQDERVRPEHVAREGKVFSWDDPPEDGHPGEPVNCRCTAEPVLDELIASLDETAPEPAPAERAAPPPLPAEEPGPPTAPAPGAEPPKSVPEILRFFRENFPMDMSPEGYAQATTLEVAEQLGVEPKHALKLLQKAARSGELQRRGHTQTFAKGTGVQKGFGYQIWELPNRTPIPEP
jgi:SPP1 gp7 family putative phage head morphogenesis protein